MNKELAKEKSNYLKRYGVYAAGTLLSVMGLAEVCGIAYVAGKVDNAHDVARHDRQAADVLRDDGDVQLARNLDRHAKQSEAWAEDMAAPVTAVEQWSGGVDMAPAAALGVLVVGTTYFGLDQLHRRRQSEEAVPAS